MRALAVGWAVTALGLAASLAAPSAATLPTTLEVQFGAAPGLAYNRLGESVLSVSGVSVIGAASLRTVKLGGVDQPDDKNYWSKLLPAQLKLDLPAGRHRLTLQTRLFVCDKTRGLCSVQTQEKRVEVNAGQTLRLTFPAPDLNAAFSGEGQ